MPGSFSSKDDGEEELRSKGSTGGADDESGPEVAPPGTGSGEKRIRFHPEVDVFVIKSSSSEFVTQKATLADEKARSSDSRYNSFRKGLFVCFFRSLTFFFDVVRWFVSLVTISCC